MIRKPLSKDVLHRLYLQEEMSIARIAISLGVCPLTVRRRMNDYGIEIRSASETMKLVPRSSEHNRRIGIAHAGKKLSQEHKEKMSRAMTGRPAWNRGLRKHLNPDKIQYGCSGPNHWAWKGGISSVNSRLRQSSRYKTWRDQVFARDDFTCQFCRKRGRELEADHIKPFSIYPELRFEVSNGRTLCKECHRRHTQEQRNGDTFI